MQNEMWGSDGREGGEWEGEVRVGGGGCGEGSGRGTRAGCYLCREPLLSSLPQLE